MLFQLKGGAIHVLECAFAQCNENNDGDLISTHLHLSYPWGMDHSMHAIVLRKISIDIISSRQ